MPKEDANDYAAKHGQDALKAAAEQQAASAVAVEAGKYKTAYDLLKKHKRTKRPSVINGLARQRDVINIVAASKMGKTWFAHNMALCVASGQPFLIEEWGCAHGNVVIFDNELHEDSIADRLPFICEEMNLHEDYLQNIIVIPLRGEGHDIKSLAPMITDIKVFNPALVIFDSLYRFLPEGTNEMDAGAITAIYNKLDQYAKIVETAAFAMIVHTTKGSQGDKAVTEVGSGTGAYVRATDNHIIVREHETEGLYVVESAARDWEHQDAIVIRKSFPVFTAVPGEDPTKLKGKKPVKEKAERRAPSKDDDAAFVALLDHNWQGKKAIVDGIARTLNMAAAAADVFFAQRVHAHGIVGLHPTDGERDCGMFEVRMGKSFEFRLKKRG